MVVLPAMAAFLALFVFIVRLMFKQGKMNAKTEHLCKAFIYIALNLLLLLILSWSLMTYTSLFKGSPWYEPCGMQFLVIFILFDPAFLTIGIALHILGKYYHVSKLNKWLPFIAIVGLSLPIFGPLNTGIWIGLPVNVILFLLVIVEVILNLVRLKKQTQAKEQLK